MLLSFWNFREPVAKEIVTYITSKELSPGYVIVHKGGSRKNIRMLANLHSLLNQTRS